MMISCLAYSLTLKLEGGDMFLPKHWLTFNGLYGIISEKTDVFRHEELLFYSPAVTSFLLSYTEATGTSQNDQPFPHIPQPAPLPPPAHFPVFPLSSLGVMFVVIIFVNNEDLGWLT
jgi:hypothetical protein